MTIDEATSLLGTDRISQNENQWWADLGCGDGLFSVALLGIIPASGKIIAIDQKPFSFSQPRITFRQLDFTKDDLHLPPLDGIMMINALHFVNDKLRLLEQLRGKLKPSGIFLLGEYDMAKSNAYVPYPISFFNARELFKAAGFGSVEKINARKSRFNNSEIYSACILNK